MILLPRSQVVSNDRSWFYPWNSVSVISFGEREREKSLPGEEWRKLVKSRWSEEEEALVKVVLVSRSTTPSELLSWKLDFHETYSSLALSLILVVSKGTSHERSPILFSTKAFLPPSRSIVSNDSTLSKDSILSNLRLFVLIRATLTEP